jgi:hypothetical protein
MSRELIGYNSNKNTTQKRKKKNTKANINKFISDPLVLALPNKPGEYLIPEIDIREYYYCTQRLFGLIADELKKYDSYDDVFAKQIFFSQTGADENGWKIFEKERKFQQALYARLGDFHEQIAGKLPGYRTLPEKHWSGLDVIKEDRSEIYEFKNRANTSTDVLTTVYEKFKKILDENKITHCVLVNVNVPKGWTKPNLFTKKQDGTIVVDLTLPKYAGRVHILSGREAYEHMSGKADFFDRLLMTMSYTFQDKSLKEALSRLSMTMNEA